MVPIVILSQPRSEMSDEKKTPAGTVFSRVKLHSATEHKIIALHLACRSANQASRKGVEDKSLVKLLNIVSLNGREFACKIG